MDRRRFLYISSAATAGCAAQCPPVASPSVPEKPTFAWLDEEQPLIQKSSSTFDIVVRGCSDTDVLRTTARPVVDNTDLDLVSSRMEATMNEAGGVGIAGPQVGLYLRVAVLKLDYKTDNPRTIFVRNPVIKERSDATIEGYEGCLSIPDVGGLVRRNKWIRIEHTTVDGKVETEEAEGYNAVLWQHELDHLDGILYVDRLLGELIPMEEVRRLRKEAEESSPKKEAHLPDNALGQEHLEGSLYLVQHRLT